MPSSPHGHAFTDADASPVAQKRPLRELVSDPLHRCPRTRPTTRTDVGAQHGTVPHKALMSAAGRHTNDGNIPKQSQQGSGSPSRSDENGRDAAGG
ncbi:hypothetical protein GCM10009793_00010 [Brachybacterium phenoliresistens]